MISLGWCDTHVGPLHEQHLVKSKDPFLLKCLPLPHLLQMYASSYKFMVPNKRSKFKQVNWIFCFICPVTILPPIQIYLPLNSLKYWITQQSYQIRRFVTLICHIVAFALHYPSLLFIEEWMAKPFSRWVCILPINFKYHAFFFGLGQTPLAQIDEIIELICFKAYLRIHKRSI